MFIILRAVLYFMKVSVVEIIKIRNLIIIKIILTISLIVFISINNIVLFYPNICRYAFSLLFSSILLVKKCFSLFQSNSRFFDTCLLHFIQYFFTLTFNLYKISSTFYSQTFLKNSFLFKN